MKFIRIHRNILMCFPVMQVHDSLTSSGTVVNSYVEAERIVLFLQNPAGQTRLHAHLVQASKSDAMCRLGMISACPGDIGKPSINARAWLFDAIIRELSRVQNGQIRSLLLFIDFFSSHDPAGNSLIHNSVRFVIHLPTP